MDSRSDLGECSSGNDEWKDSLEDSKDTLPYCVPSSPVGSDAKSHSAVCKKGLCMWIACKAYAMKSLWLSLFRTSTEDSNIASFRVHYKNEQVFMY
jgi:hypothetical protein